MKVKPSLIIAFLIVMNAMSLFSFYRTNSHKSELLLIVESRQEQITDKDFAITRLKSDIRNSFSILNDTTVQEDMSLPMLVLRAQERNCERCITNSMRIVNDMSIPNEKFLFLSNKKNPETLREKFDLGNYKITYDSKMFPVNTTSTGVYFFVLDENGEIQAPYFPEEDMTDLTQAYLDMVTAKYLTADNESLVAIN